MNFLYSGTGVEIKNRRGTRDADNLITQLLDHGTIDLSPLPYSYHIPSTYGLFIPCCHFHHIADNRVPPEAVMRVALWWEYMLVGAFYLRQYTRSNPITFLCASDRMSVWWIGTCSLPWGQVAKFKEQGFQSQGFHPCCNHGVSSARGSQHQLHIVWAHFLACTAPPWITVYEFLYVHQSCFSLKNVAYHNMRIGPLPCVLHYKPYAKVWGVHSYSKATLVKGLLSSPTGNVN